MKKFLDVSRNHFITKSPAFKAFRDKVQDIISPLNTELRFIYDHGVLKAKKVTEPFLAIGSGKKEKDPFAKLQHNLMSLAEGKNDKDKREFIQETIDLIRDKKTESAPKIIDQLQLKKQRFELDNTEHTIIYIEPNLPVTKTIEYDDKSKKAIIKISSTIFEERDVDFFGEIYKLNYVQGKQNDSGVSINRQNKRIFINITNKNIINYSITFIDILLILEYAHKTSGNNVDVMKTTMIKLLGGGYQSNKKAYANMSEHTD